MNQEAGEPSKKSSPSLPTRRPVPRRRGGRGRRRPEGREPNPKSAEGTTLASEQPSPVSPSKPPDRTEPNQAAPLPQQRQQAQHRPVGSPIVQATAQVEEVIKSLREALRELEEVLEVLDDAQRQQIGDEKEIESLRRSLSVLQRERQSAPREESRGRYESRSRPEIRNRGEEQRSSEKSSTGEPSRPTE